MSAPPDSVPPLVERVARAIAWEGVCRETRRFVGSPEALTLDHDDYDAARAAINAMGRRERDVATRAATMFKQMAELVDARTAKDAEVSPMLDRVARALSRHDRLKMPMGHYYARARSVIQEMREPTDAMIEADYVVTYDIYLGSFDDNSDPKHAASTWRAMIKAALERGSE